MIFSNFSLLSQKNGLLLQRSQKPIGNYPVEQRFLCSSVMVGIFYTPIQTHIDDCLYCVKFDALTGVTYHFVDSAIRQSFSYARNLIVHKMTNLVFQSSNGRNITTSLTVAPVFGKEHFHVLRDIDNLSCSDEFRKSNFEVMFKIRQLPCGGSRKERYFEMTKDGFLSGRFDINAAI